MRVFVRYWKCIYIWIDRHSVMYPRSITDKHESLKKLIYTAVHRSTFSEFIIDVLPRVILNWILRKLCWMFVVSAPPVYFQCPDIFSTFPALHIYWIYYMRYIKMVLVVDYPCSWFIFVFSTASSFLPQQSFSNGTKSNTESAFKWSLCSTSCNRCVCLFSLLLRPSQIEVVPRLHAYFSYFFMNT
jgi:hypothetical protein